MPPRVGVVTIGDACEKRLVTERVELATSESCVICDCTSAIRTSEIILSQSVLIVIDFDFAASVCSRVTE